VISATSRHRSERGSILFLVLLSTALVGYLANRLVATALAHSSLTRNFDAGITHQQSMRTLLQRPLTTSRSCSVQTLGQLGGDTQDWYVCTMGALPFLATPPISLPPGRIDYNSVFSRVTPCSFARRSDSLARLSSPHAAMTCHLPALLSSDIISTDNLAAETLMISAPASPGTTTIATVGSLRVSENLSLTAPTLILAGGDITIARITSQSSTPVAVTIVSAHGDIQVGSTGSGISLLTLGRRLRVAPPTPPSTSFPLPPFITVPFSGIRPLRAG
jgi:hypothetical protein